MGAILALKDGIMHMTLLLGKETLYYYILLKEIPRINTM